MNKADDCVEILIKNPTFQINYEQLLAKTMAVYNFTHKKDNKEQKLNIPMI